MSEAAKRTSIIINSSAGLDDTQNSPDAIRQIFQSCSHDCSVAQVKAGDDIREMALNAVRGGSGLVVAGGGDGTLRAVAGALAGTGVAMGVLPVGTLNHFARDLEIPLELNQAARAAAAGVAVAVDVAEVNGHVFINNSVIGLYPSYRADRNQRQQRGQSKPMAMLTAMFAMVRRYPFVTVRLRLDGQEIVRRTPYILVANNEHAMEGLKPWARESMTAGQLTLYILRDTSRLGLFRTLLKTLTGGKLAESESEFEVVRTPEVRVETHRKRMKVALDGELLTLDTPLVYRSRPGDLRVVVPRDSKRVAEAHEGGKRNEANPSFV